MFGTILLAVDESEHSVKAAELTTHLAPRFDGEVIVLHVHETLPARGVPVDIRLDEVEVADATATKLKDQGVSARPEEAKAYHGLVANRIVSTARENGADLIVMGSRGLSDIAGMFLGSVAHKVLHLAECPVLIAR
jgi:nucleotide-binding universal stress UspA family protein